MNELLTVANWLLPLLYLALMIDYGVTFFLRVRTTGSGASILAVVLCHAGLFALRGIHLGYPPLLNPYEVLSFIAISIAAVYWLLERVGRDRRAGAFVFLIAFAFQYTSSVFLGPGIGEGAAPRNVPGANDQVHAILATFAYTGLILAGLFAALQLLIERSLKRHRFGPLFDRLPPVELLGRMIWCALLVGFGFLTISVLTGALVFSHLQAGATSPLWKAKTTLKIVLGSVTWAICLVGVLGKVLGKWPMRRVSVVAVLGVLVILALLITSAVLT